MNDGANIQDFDYDAIDRQESPEVEGMDFSQVVGALQFILRGAYDFATVGRRVVLLCYEAGIFGDISQAELGRRCGLNPGRISEYRTVEMQTFPNVYAALRKRRRKIPNDSPRV